MWPNWAIFKVLGHKFSYKSSPIILGNIFTKSQTPIKSKICHGYFLGNFLIKLGYFLFQDLGTLLPIYFTLNGKMISSPKILKFHLRLILFRKSWRPAVEQTIYLMYHMHDCLPSSRSLHCFKYFIRSRRWTFSWWPCSLVNAKNYCNHSFPLFFLPTFQYVPNKSDNLFETWALHVATKLFQSVHLSALPSLSRKKENYQIVSGVVAWYSHLVIN